jgi:serine/threonine protein kinase
MLGIVHCDIKPENIPFCLSDPKQIKLIDFGIARRYRTVSSPGYRDLEARKAHLLGTVTWASLNAHYGIGMTPPS